jgi:hypothetical protein
MSRSFSLAVIVYVLFIIVLAGMSVGIFVYGLKLQMPVWPDMQELGRQFVPAEKK